MPQLMIEILCEEIPAHAQKPGYELWYHLLRMKLSEAGLLGIEAADDLPSSFRYYVTPQRMTVMFEDVQPHTKALKEEKRGPRLDAPTHAIEGFAKSVGLRIEELITRETPKGVFYFAKLDKPAQAIEEVLPGLFQQALEEMKWPKSMRWSTYSLSWIRPIRQVLGIFDGTVIALEPNFASNQTRGHRFLAPTYFSVSNFEEYQAKLNENYVILDFEERKSLIKEQADELLAKKNVCCLSDEVLLEEVAGLVEWPCVLLGTIDGTYMSLPSRVLTTVMRHHQRYFPTMRAQGDLSPTFVIVSNMESTRPTKIIQENERVLSARFEDALFFVNTDLKRSLEEHARKLTSLVFHKNLGSMAEKVSAMQSLASHLWPMFSDLNNVEGNLKDVHRAIELMKADLATQMVGEFPELQGYIGAFYARQQDEKESVARAIELHYAPQGPSDACPKDPLAVFVSLIDKLLTLVGFFAIGEKPTGSKDPFALRRTALGIIRLIIENKIRYLSLDDLMRATMEVPFIRDKATIHVQELTAHLKEFFKERLKAMFKNMGFRHDMIMAVLSQEDAETHMVATLEKLEALNVFSKQQDMLALLVGYKRACNILKQSGEDSSLTSLSVDISLFQEEAEKVLYDALTLTHQKVTHFLSLVSPDYLQALHMLAHLREPVDQFFDHVTVNVTDKPIRKNRLMLLALTQNVFEKVANFSTIEG